MIDMRAPLPLLSVRRLRVSHDIFILISHGSAFICEKDEIIGFLVTLHIITCHDYRRYSRRYS